MAAIAKRFQIELEFFGFAGEEKFRRLLAAAAAQLSRIQLENRQRREERRIAVARESVPQHLWSDVGLGL